jgi:hypothetical protein
MRLYRCFSISLVFPRIPPCSPWFYFQPKDELPVINEDEELLGVIRSLDILREWVEDLLLAQGDETGSFY